MADDPFLRAIVADPGDDTTRLVYADWLDEQDDPRGVFLRLEVALAAVAPLDAGRGPLQARFLEAAAGIHAAWLSAVSRVPVAACLAMIGSWQIEGHVTLFNRPDPDTDDTVWTPNRISPGARSALRCVGYTFRADGTGEFAGLGAP